MKQLPIRVKHSKTRDWAYHLYAGLEYSLVLRDWAAILMAGGAYLWSTASGHLEGIYIISLQGYLPVEHHAGYVVCVGRAPLSTLVRYMQLCDSECSTMLHNINIPS